MAPRTVVFEKSLAAVNPDLVDEWHPTLNGEVAPSEIGPGSKFRAWWECAEATDHVWEATVVNRSKGTGCPMCLGRVVVLSNCLASTHPELAAQWHPTKNGDATPNGVTALSTKAIWWKCPEGADHEWEAKIERRVAGSGCLVCSGHKVVPSNCLASTHPELAAQWHPTKNGGLTPEDVCLLRGPNKVWWKCPEGADHEWEAGVRKRAQGSGCLVCSGHKVVPSNCLASTHPELAAQWHPTKNGGLTPEDVKAGVNRSFWWKCPEGDDHEWEARSSHRVNGHGCPICSGRKVVPSNCLASTHPELAAQWHPTKNGGLTPYDVVSGTHKQIWWQCPKDPEHEWETSGNKRSLGSNCQICAGYKPPETKPMSVTHPELAAQFHPTLNGDLTPDSIKARTRQELWWQCPKGDDHVWQAKGLRRAEGSGCHVCSNQKIVLSNSMATTHPELAAQWHPTKNGGLTPYDVASGTHKQIWWQCPKDPEHEWEAISNSRLRGVGCPLCNRGWTVEKVREFVRSLLESGLYASLTQAEMWVLFQQNGLLARHNSKRFKFVRALSTKRLNSEDLEGFANGGTSRIDELIDGEADVPDFLNASDAVNEIDLDDVDDDDFEPELPRCSVAKALDALESSVWASADVEAVQFLESSAVRKMWVGAYNDPQQALVDSLPPRDHEYSERARKRFNNELTGALSLPLPEGYDFTIAGIRAEPNLMQRHVAVLVRDQCRVGNWSGTGAGKTLSAVLASRAVNADVTVICCPNSTIRGWETTISNAFPDARIVTKSLNPVWDDNDGPRYLIVNYEQFQQPNSEPDARHLVEQFSVDMVVIDELHYAKQRQADESKRRKAITGFVGFAAETKHARDNTDLHVLGMTATPVINNLRECVSLIEMVSGAKDDSLLDKPTIQNAQRVYQKLTTLGPRLIPNYPEPAATQPTINISHRLEDILNLSPTRKSVSMLPLEQLLLEEKLGTIVSYVGTGTVIYSEYVDGMIGPLVKAVEQAGFTVGVCTGQDKSGLGPFKHGDLDVLIGSSTIGTGVDGLQNVASRLIIASAPWTSAGYEQLVGRLVRTGQQQPVDVIFPLTYIVTDDGTEWSYDRSNRLNRIRYKKTIADAAVDGVVPEGALRTPADAYRDAMGWLERLTQNNINDPTTRPIEANLSESRVDPPARQVRYGKFSATTNRWNSSYSTTTHNRLIEHPEEWHEYHRLYDEARDKWTVIPYQRLANRIGKGSRNLVVADFGCGQDHLGQQLRTKGFTVHSFDHIAANEHVTALDIAEGTAIKENSVDIAVFSLSLMGVNNGDYLREAARVSAYDSSLHVIERTSAIERIGGVEARLAQFGYQTETVETFGNPEFTHIHARRTDHVPEPNLNML